MNPTLKKAIVAVGAVVVTVGGIYTFTMYQKGMRRVAAMNADVLPPFEELKEGPRAKTSTYFDIAVGKNSLDEVNAKVLSWNLKCADTSMRALMQQGRDAKKKEIEEVKARGGDVDAISGASMVNYRSKKERNPQVRMSCEVNARDLKDRPRTDDVDGRFLFVHDSLNHPVRHVSFRRLHANHPAAWDDLKASIAAMTETFGPPMTTSDLPSESEDGSIRFERFKKYAWTWKWADLAAEVTATNLGRGVDVNESVEVPWPTRSDAPSLGPDAVTNPPPRIQTPNPLTPELKILLDEMDARKKAKRSSDAAAKKKDDDATKAEAEKMSPSFKEKGAAAIESARRAKKLRDANAKAQENAATPP